MVDPLVTEWHSRDLDSLPSQREVDAVNDWRTTNKTYQIMRDNPVHNAKIMGGLFGMQFKGEGVDGQKKRNLAKDLFNKIFLESNKIYTKLESRNRELKLRSRINSRK